MSDVLVLAEDVRSALAANRPVVALESTVIAHGLPQPINLDTARTLEQIVREAGATPATTAIIEGHLRVGLGDDELEHLATSSGIKKVSIRDLPVAVANKWNGATTVASTCWIAHRSGINVFATGGIGGVHRGSLPDVSADLPQLAQTPIIVVCSGAKIVLDLPATREWLETHGVTIVGYGCDEMPAFYSRKSGLNVDVKVESAMEVAQLFKAQQLLGTHGALLVTVPVPNDCELPLEDTERMLVEALRESEMLRISGRELTPFLLNQLAERSQGRSLKANVALLRSNARIAAEIARAMADNLRIDSRSR